MALILIQHDQKSRKPGKNIVCTHFTGSSRFCPTTGNYDICLIGNKFLLHPSPVLYILGSDADCCSGYLLVFISTTKPSMDRVFFKDNLFISLPPVLHNLYTTCLFFTFSIFFYLHHHITIIPHTPHNYKTYIQYKMLAQEI